MEDLIQRYKDQELLDKITEFQKQLINTHPKFKVGQVISFLGGMNRDLPYKSKITGFNKDGGIYVVWDCYWFPIEDTLTREIKIE